MYGMPYVQYVGCGVRGMGGVWCGYRERANWRVVPGVHIRYVPLVEGTGAVPQARTHSRSKPCTPAPLGRFCSSAKVPYCQVAVHSLGVEGAELDVVAVRGIVPQQRRGGGQGGGAGGCARGVRERDGESGQAAGGDLCVRAMGWWWGGGGG